MRLTVPRALRRAGLDPSSPAAINYAIDNGFCFFVVNE